MSFRRNRIFLVLIFVLCSCKGGSLFKTGNSNTNRDKIEKNITNGMENAQSENKEGRALFPRIEYNGQWMPVSRADPLKDPTFDYMPPVLERVKYWSSDGTSHKNRNEILLLGMPSKKHIAMNKIDKYGPVKRTYYSTPYQSHFPSQNHQQQQQQPSQSHQQRIIPYSHSKMSQQNLQSHGWPPNIYHSDLKSENSIKSKTVVRYPLVISTTTFRPHSSPFLPTFPPTSTSNSMMHYTELEDSKMSSSPALPMKPKNNDNGLMRDTTKPLLHSILQTETASPFTKKPSSAYQIEYASNIYNPETINSMVTLQSYKAALTPTKPSIRPLSTKTEAKISNLAQSTKENDDIKHYVQPEMHTDMGWPVFNLIIEGHSKVKTYSSKNDDPIGNRLPNIRPIQAKETPIVEYVTDNKSTAKPEFQKVNSNPQQTAMSLLSIIDGSFGNFFGTGSKEESIKKRHVEKRTKRNVLSLEMSGVSRQNQREDNQERIIGVTFQVDDDRPQIYREGSVISESLWSST